MHLLYMLIFFFLALFEQNCISEHQETIAKLESAYAIQLEGQKEEASVALKEAAKEVKIIMEMAGVH